MAEAALSVLILGVVLVAALNTVGSSKASQQRNVDRTRGTQLAQDLMTEILEQAYANPGGGIGAMGIDPAEVGDGNRALWDDIDDYDGWSASPPQTKDGSALDAFEGWSRSVEVEWVSSLDFSVTHPFDTGVKRITVTVAHNTLPVGTLVAIRTRSWENFGDAGGGGGVPGNNPPTAVAVLSTEQGPKPLAVWCSAGSSTDPDPGDVLTYSWDFGDGNNDQGEMVQHTFDDAGMFFVTLTVSDGRGGTDIATVKVTVWN